MGHTVVRIAQFGLLAASDTEQVDTSNQTAASWKKFRITLTQDAIEKRTKLDALAGAEPQLPCAGPNEPSRCCNILEKLFFVTKRLLLQLLEKGACRFLRRAVFTCGSEDGQPQVAQKLVLELRRFTGVVGTNKCGKSAGGPGARTGNCSFGRCCHDSRRNLGPTICLRYGGGLDMSSTVSKRCCLGASSRDMNSDLFNTNVDK